jgi:hypothetical protein
MDFQFKNNWLVNYDPKEFNYPDILITLAQIQDKFHEIGINFNSININFNNEGKKNQYFKENDAVLLSFCGIQAEFEKIDTKPGNAAVLEPLDKPIKTISLLFPRLESDSRWKSMGLPAGQLFLASNLSAGGFKVSPLPLTLPAENPPAEALSADMTGLTLFEDLLPSLGPFLARFRASCMGILAAGGPFPTLAPLASIFHLPQVNLFVRGEAEMALPGILKALNRGDGRAFFSHEGVFWRQPGLIAMAGFDRINRPQNFSGFVTDLSFLRPAQVRHGLEMNFSRGCRRGCVFCCRVQGGEFRKLPLEAAAELLENYSKKIDESAGAARAANINDDDILQEPAYAREIFALLKKNGWRIFGIQTSMASLVNSDGRPPRGRRLADGSPDLEVLDLVSDPQLFVESRPLLWLGTDTFLPERARRLGKKVPSGKNFTVLLAEMEKRALRHFHYWISSDGDSNWEEFVDELALIFGFFRDFPGFGLLAHAPFIVPYPASRLFGALPANDPRLKIKLALEAPDPRFSFNVVERLETSWPQLNQLLKNEKAGGEKGFFDFLKEKDFITAAQLAYHFSKQEQLQGEKNDIGLSRAQESLEKVIGALL